jgi:hypothetical protein
MASGGHVMSDDAEEVMSEDAEQVMGQDAAVMAVLSCGDGYRGTSSTTPPPY